MVLYGGRKAEGRVRKESARTAGGAGGAMTRGLGTATHGNNSAGGKSVWNCYCIKITIVSECELYVMALDQRNALYSLNEENLKHRH